MLTCPSCSASNDPANRFCDQCGTRLEDPASASAAPGATASGSTCPTCGAAVLPGEAFCDACGASLQDTVLPAATADAPTMFAPPPVAATSSDTSATASANVTCMMCGHQNVPGDRFCDNCGANLQPDTAAVAASGDATVMASTPTPAATPTTSPTAADVMGSPSPDAVSPAVEAPPAIEATLPVAEEAPPSLPPATDTQNQVEPASPPAEPAAAPAEVAAVATPSDDQNAEIARIEGVIAQQRQVISQLEQTQSVLGAATPPAILQALDEARSSLAQAEADLQTRQQPPAPAVDPAEVARIEGVISQQRQVVSQLEQTQSVLGAATPAAILQALDEARGALAKAEADLQGLQQPGAGAQLGTGPLAGAALAPIAPPDPAIPAPQQAAPADAGIAQGTLPIPTPAVPPAAMPVPAASPAPTGARLVLVEGGTELPLPTDRAEIIIGREDPISQIFPEIDLTPFGGETGGVSRQHARLNHSNGEWTLTDLNSTNYTRVEGAKIDPNTPVPIKNGARLQFGRIATVFHV